MNSKGSHAWIQTFSGLAFDYLEPKVDTICIEDIAHALGLLCRYCGHSNSFYSVAEHCVIGSNVVAPEVALHFLLHDALEAYITDIPRPLKRLLPGYLAIEKRLEPIIYEALHLKFPSKGVAEAVKEADLRMLMTEQPQLLLPPPIPWNFSAEPYSVSLPCWSPVEASSMYLTRFNELLNRE